VSFTGRLQLDFGDFSADNPDWDGGVSAGRIAITLGAISWRGYTLEAGFMSDGASVPRLLWWFLPPWGDRTTIASLFHDKSCDMQKAGTPILGCDTRAKCDRLFRECFVELSFVGWARANWWVRAGMCLSIPRAWLCWSGVRAYSIYEALTTR